jgi:hypothetical protein
MSKKRILVGVTLLVAVCGGLVVWKQQAQAQAPTVPSVGARADASSESRHGDEGAAPAAAVVTLGSYLGTYFGPRWEQVRPSTGLPQEALAQRIDPASIPRWEDVEPQMLADLETSCADIERQAEDALKWDDAGHRTDTFDFSAPVINPDQKTLTAADLQTIRAALQPFDDSIRDSALSRAALMLPALKDAYAAGSYEKAPFVRVLPERLRDAHLCAMKVFATDSWNMVLGFVEGDSPAYDAANEMVQQTRIARLKKAIELVASIK